MVEILARGAGGTGDVYEDIEARNAFRGTP